MFVEQNVDREGDYGSRVKRNFGGVKLHEECKRAGCNPHGFPGDALVQRAGINIPSIVIRTTSLDRIIEFPSELA